jgi:RNA polymerase sigma-70 factor (ECF subfamily)
MRAIEDDNRMTERLATSSDEELLRLMMKGDAEAFELLYDRRQGVIYRFALRMSGSEAVAEDVTQDVLIALMRDGSQFDPSRGTVAAYLYGMARHRVLRRIERDKSFIAIADEGKDESSAVELFIAEDDPLAALTRSRMIDAVRQAILALPAHYREVVVLTSLHEMNYDEAAEIIGCPVGTVRSRLHRARAMLIDKLRDWGKNEPATPDLLTARCAL